MLIQNENQSGNIKFTNQDSQNNIEAELFVCINSKQQRKDTLFKCMLINFIRMESKKRQITLHKLINKYEKTHNQVAPAVLKKWKIMNN